MNGLDCHRTSQMNEGGDLFFLSLPFRHAMNNGKSENHNNLPRVVIRTKGRKEEEYAAGRKRKKKAILPASCDSILCPAGEQRSAGQGPSLVTTESVSQWVTRIWRTRKQLFLLLRLLLHL